MSHAAIDQVLQRAESAKSESDFTYFFSLLLAGEALAKTTVLGFIAAIQDDRDRNRYRLEHSLAKADGSGEWAKALEDVLTGAASQYLLLDARTEQTELTRLCRAGDWQYESVASLKAALNKLNIASEEFPTKTDMKRWFRLFTTLRNGTRAHGATLPGKAGAAAQDLLQSLTLFASNHSLLNRPWAYLYRNLSGKYQVSGITRNVADFDFLKKENDRTYQNGIYIFGGAPRIVPPLSRVTLSYRTFSLPTVE